MPRWPSLDSGVLGFGCAWIRVCVVGRRARAARACCSRTGRLFSRRAAGELFQLDHHRTLASGDQLLGVAAIAGIESNLARVIGVDGPLARRAHGLQGTLLPKRNDDILVVEMHRRGSIRKPRVL